MGNDYGFPMSKAEILREIPLLAKEERDELRLALAELDGDGWDDIDAPLSAAEKALIDQRVADFDKDPSAAVPWPAAVERLRERFPG
jgi:putative addiction module component (TIGR02574 family)